MNMGLLGSFTCLTHGDGFLLARFLPDSSLALPLYDKAVTEIV